MKIQEGETDANMEMKFQVVDVSKALLSVHRVCEQGHAVLFTNQPGGSAILVGGDVRNRILDQIIFYIVTAKNKVFQNDDRKGDSPGPRSP